MYSSDIPPVCPTTQTDTTTDTRITEQPNSISPAYRIGITSLVIIVVLLAVVTTLVAVMMVQQKRWKAKKQAIMNGDDTTYSNLAYNSELVCIATTTRTT